MWWHVTAGGWWCSILLMPLTTIDEVVKRFFHRGKFAFFAKPSTI
jgi:hypothetical protein